MARKRTHQAGIGALVVLALLGAGDLGLRAESAAPGSVGAKPKEKVLEKVSDKAVEKGGAKTLPVAQAHIPLPRARPQKVAGGPSPTLKPAGGPAAAPGTAAAGPTAAPSSGPARAPLPPAASLAISAADLAVVK
jgi:hypothetical protein